MSASTQVLGEKEVENFKKAERLLSKKLYKQALKHCDLVLKKAENHGETQALKGAILGRLAITEEEKQEAIDLCKRGVMANMGSKASWIALARLYKQFLRYEESIKSFKSALNPRLSAGLAEKRDWKRDLAFMLAQTRNWSELADIRRQQQLDMYDATVNWVGYCLALYFQGNVALALSSFREFKSSLSSQLIANHPDLDMFEARLVEDSLPLADQLSFYTQLLEKNTPGTNILSCQEAKARIELELGQYVQAQESFTHLIVDRNLENYDYHRGLQCALSCSFASFKRGGVDLPLVAATAPLEVVEKALQVYAGLQEKFPKSIALDRIVLDFCPDAEFESRATSFVRKLLKKQAPSLFSLVKPLYVSRQTLAEKSFLAIGQAMILEFSENKDVLVMAYLFLAQHFDKCSRGSSDALCTIHQAIALEPSNTDLLRCKARILKHQGNLLSAFEVVDQARNCELSDRYLNNKCAKYAFRKKMPELALALTHLFTRGEDLHSLPNASVLHDLQCMWFELEAGHCALKQNKIIFALKNFNWINVHFAQFREDEYDFHEYCLRKLTLTSYVNLVRMEDSLYTSRAFVRSAEGALLCWLKVYNEGAGLEELKQYEKEEKAKLKVEAASTDESQFAGMTPSQKKLAQKKIKADKLEQEKVEEAKKLEAHKQLLAGSAQKKQEDGNEEEEGAAAAQEEATPDKAMANMSMNERPRNKRKSDVPPDADPFGFKRFASLVKDPLKPCVELCELAFKKGQNEDQVELQCLAHDVYVRVGKKDLAWTHLLNAAQSSSWKHPSVLRRLIVFAHFFQAAVTPACWTKFGAKPSAVADKGNETTGAGVLLALGGKSPVEVALAALQDSSPEVRLSAAEALWTMNVEEAAASDAASAVVFPFESCFRAQRLLKQFKSKSVEAHLKAAKVNWPQATYL